jgi:hypothetical protein
MVCLELFDARDHAERVAPDARGVDVRLPEGEPLELVRRATALLELADPAEQTEQVLALRVRLRRVEHLLAPDPDPWHVA